MRRAYSTDATAEFDRVRVGQVDSTTRMDLAHGNSSPDSIVYGTLYSRHKDPPLNSTNTTKATLSVKWGSRAGLVKQGTNLANRDIPFSTGTAASVNAKGSNPPANARVYHNYPTQDEVEDPNGLFKGKWPDGPMPDNFPSVIPNGGDGVVSDAEWTAYWKGAPVGTLESTNLAVIYGVRRPSSEFVDASIPVTYDPVAANSGVTGSNFEATATTSLPLGGSVAVTTLGAATVTTNATVPNAQVFNQALSSPNDRDYLPTNPSYLNSTGNFTAMSPTVTRGMWQNNVYVNYDPTRSSGQLRLAYCNRRPCLPYNGSLTNDSMFDIANQPTNGHVSVASMNLTDTDLFPQVSNAAATDLSTGRVGTRPGYFDGNMIIDAGRYDDATGKPLRFSGTLLINGDLVIRGRLQGTGRLVARGNIYVVGDLVYDCGSASANTSRVCTKAEYADPGNLPRVALLAGGNIIVGDYDMPDSRINGNGSGGRGNRASDLINDQAGQDRIPTATTTGGWAYWKVPGSTGRPNRNSNSMQGRAGFLTRTLQEVNGRNFKLPTTASTPAVYYKLNPFGHMVASNGAPGEYYETSGYFVGRPGTTGDNRTNATFTAVLNPLYPSNGPLKIGSAIGNNDNGLATYTGLPALGGAGPSNPGCISTVPTTTLTTASIAPTGGGLVQIPAMRWNTTTTTGTITITTAPTATALGTGQNILFGYWCAPQTTAAGQYVRAPHASATPSDPGRDTVAWQQQSPYNQGGTVGTVAYVGPDNNNGLTTGWLGGLVNSNTQIGDLSQTRLLKMMWLSTIEGGRVKRPLRTDGIYYSRYTIATILRWGRDHRNDSNASSTQARWIHNGSVIAADLGFLITGQLSPDCDCTNGRNRTLDFDAEPNATQGTVGAGMTILYDDRLQGFLQLESANEVRLLRSGGYTQVTP
jgi:hypothetical protein